MGLKIYRIRWKKRKIRAITAFKVIQGHRGRYQSKARMRLLISDNWRLIIFVTVSELSQLIVQILDTLRFWTPFGGLGTTYDVHLGLIEKRVVDFLLVLIEFLFARCYGWFAIRAKRDRKSAISLHATRSVWSKISDRRGRPHQSFLHG